MKSPFTGGCSCGAIRFECNPQPDEVMMFKCHCRDCQRISGGGHVPVVFFPRHRFRLVKGAIRHHFTESDQGGRHQRGFCPDCGSRLTGGEGLGMDSIGLVAGCLDDPSWFRAQEEYWTIDAQPWDPLDPGIPHHDKVPSG